MDAKDTVFVNALANPADSSSSMSASADVSVGGCRHVMGAAIASAADDATGADDVMGVGRFPTANSFRALTFQTNFFGAATELWTFACF